MLSGRWRMGMVAALALALAACGRPPGGHGDGKGDSPGEEHDGPRNDEGDSETPEAPTYKPPPPHFPGGWTAQVPDDTLDPENSDDPSDQYSDDGSDENTDGNSDGSWEEHEDDGAGEAENCGPGKTCAPVDLVRFWVADRFGYDDHKPVPLDPKYDVRLLAKAQPDECFNGIGQPIGHPDSNGQCNGPFPDTGTPKTNQAYVWSQANTGDAVWFGTVANTHCIVMSDFLGIAIPHENSHWVCEFNASTSGTGDFRPPDLYRYDLQTDTLQPKNPPTSSIANDLRLATLGFRAAGTVDGVVFLAGPAVPQLGGINMFAFDAVTGDLLGANNFPQWNDIRSFVTANGVLYAGVGNTDIPDPSAPGGSVLRWTGTRSTNPLALFQFDVVGDIREEAANLTTDGTRLFLSGWPVVRDFSDVRLAGVWRSPRLSCTGLTTEDAAHWDQLFRIDQYDPDPVAAATTALGDLKIFDGKLYFGTMNVPFLGTAAALELANEGQLDLDCNGDGQLGPEELVATALGTHRSVSLFAIPDPEGHCEHTELLYGERFLPKYVPHLRRYAINDNRHFSNQLEDPQPRWGASGLGNFFNAYEWSMAIHDDQLFIGTFDWSQLARVGILELLGIDNGPEATQLQSLQASAARLTLDQLGSTVFPKEGADLFRVGEDSCGAVAESLTGVGNDTNYGVRTMTTTERALYVGTANPMNLHPDGGWELLELTRQCGPVDDSVITDAQ